MNTELTPNTMLIEPPAPLTPAEAKRYKKLKTVFSKWYEDRFMAGAALKEIRDSRLYRQEYPTFESFCEEQFTVKRATAYRMIEAAEVKASLRLSENSDKVKNENQAVALKDVPEAEREEVLKRAAETGKVTAKSITEAAAQQQQSRNSHAKSENPAKEEKPPARLDKTGYEIPEKILADWDRATETAKRNMSALSDIRVELKHALAEKDVIFAEVTNTAIADLDNAYTTFKLVLPFAVCTSCAGHTRARCALCKRRGFLSDFAYRMYVPAEIKKIREKSVAGRKVLTGATSESEERENL